MEIEGSILECVSEIYSTIDGVKSRDLVEQAMMYVAACLLSLGRSWFVESEVRVPGFLFFFNLFGGEPGLEGERLWKAVEGSGRGFGSGEGKGKEVVSLFRVEPWIWG